MNKLIINNHLYKNVNVIFNDNRQSKGFLTQTSIKSSDTKDLLVECYALVNCNNDELFLFFKEDDVREISEIK